jgi:hypothetical protein
LGKTKVIDSLLLLLILLSFFTPFNFAFYSCSITGCCFIALYWLCSFSVALCLALTSTLMFSVRVLLIISSSSLLYSLIDYPSPTSRFCRWGLSYVFQDCIFPYISYMHIVIGYSCFGMFLRIFSSLPLSISYNLHCIGRQSQQVIVLYHTYCYPVAPLRSKLHSSFVHPSTHHRTRLIPNRTQYPTISIPS